jgi:8-oxo-dGTP pyrophosphatase MutT (NUDIX family)
MGKPPVATRDAATVILMRDADASFEIYLMRRHRNQAFMGGAFVFPGGRLDEKDCDPALLPYVHGMTPGEAVKLLGEPGLDGNTAIGLFLSAIRETFEECGILLAVGKTGKPFDPTSLDVLSWRNYRRALHDGTMTLGEFAESAGIFFAPRFLVPYSHWITPEVEAKRFDTRFFITHCPEGQVCIYDSLELTEARWTKPAAALADNREKQIVLMPPTLKTIEELNACNTMEEVFEFARGREIYPILPEAFVMEKGFGVKLPYDRDYTIARYKKPQQPDEPSRIIHQDGIWQTAFAE